MRFTIFISLRRVFNAVQRLEFQSAYMAYRSAYNSLSSLALQRNLCRWPCRPKQHQLEHLVFEWMPYNPRYFHNYLNEDAIRRVKGLAIRSHPAHMSQHVLLKYSLQQCLQWRQKFRMVAARHSGFEFHVFVRDLSISLSLCIFFLSVSLSLYIYIFFFPYKYIIYVYIYI